MAAAGDRRFHRQQRRTLSPRKGLFVRVTQIGKLSDSEWGWIASTVVWQWISTRAAQAASEGLDLERAIRTTRLNPDPWDIGAIKAILARAGEIVCGVRLVEAREHLDEGRTRGVSR